MCNSIDKLSFLCYTDLARYYLDTVVLVVRRTLTLQIKNLRFESSVILNGTQTLKSLSFFSSSFESSVILNGTQTWSLFRSTQTLFESSVILNGTQT